MVVLKVFFLSGRSGDDVSLSSQVCRGGIGKREKQLFSLKKINPNPEIEKKYLLKEVNLNAFLKVGEAEQETLIGH